MTVIIACASVACPMTRPAQRGVPDANPGCAADAECPAGHSCIQYCGNGWCHGACL
ncbi:MAG TPA: hypothetical protein VGQ83_09615 [Polyangia bacterium]|jgi:hypothetical protein